MSKKSGFNLELVKATMNAMGYTEEIKECGKCKFSEEKEDQAGMWYHVCNYSNLTSFTVKANAHCNFYEKKEG
jgi:hypothetical protein